MNKLFLSAFWVLSALLSYWFGMNHGMNAVAPNDPPAPLMVEAVKAVDPGKITPVDTKAVPKKREQAVVNTSGATGEENSNKRPKKSSIIERIRDANPVTRLQAFAELLGKPTENNISIAREHYEDLPEGPTRFSELRMLTFSWGQVDPQAAMEWVQGLDSHEQRMGANSVLDAWARKDADSAISWAKENFEGEDNPYFIGIMHGLTEANLFKATDLMTSLPYGRVRGRAASIVMGKAWQMGEGVALHLADNLPEGSVQNFAFGEVAEKIAKEDIDRAVEWVGNMENSEIKITASENIARAWAKENPVAASKWVSSMPEGQARMESMEKVVSVWAKQDPVATAEWLNEFPSGEFMDEPITAFVREVARKDPENALTWAQAIVDNEKRKRVEKEVTKMVAQLRKAEKNKTDSGP